MYIRPCPRTGVFFLALFICLFVSGCATGSAKAPQQTTVVKLPKDGPPTVAEMAALSDLVLIGRVTKSDARWYGKKIMTVSDVEPVRTLKGASPATTIKVVTYGGTVGVITQEFTHSVSLQEGETAMLFLHRTDPDSKLFNGHFMPFDEFGKIGLLRPEQRFSRLKNNRRLNRFIDDIETRVKQGGTR